MSHASVTGDHTTVAESANADGYAINRSPYVRAVGELGVLAANASVRVTLQFNNPSNVPISYSERVVTGGAP